MISLFGELVYGMSERKRVENEASLNEQMAQARILGANRLTVTSKSECDRCGARSRGKMCEYCGSDKSHTFKA